MIGMTIAVTSATTSTPANNEKKVDGFIGSQ